MRRPLRFAFHKKNNAIKPTKRATPILIVAGVLTITSSQGATYNPRQVLAAIVGVIGLGLLVGSFFGRSRGVMLLVPVLLVLGAIDMAVPYEWNSLREIRTARMVSLAAGNVNLAIDPNSAQTLDVTVRYGTATIRLDDPGRSYRVNIDAALPTKLMSLRAVIQDRGPQVQFDHHGLNPYLNPNEVDRSIPPPDWVLRYEPGSYQSIRGKRSLDFGEGPQTVVTVTIGGGEVWVIDRREMMAKKLEAGDPATAEGGSL